jgi:hypothetical protein
VRAKAAKKAAKRQRQKEKRQAEILAKGIGAPAPNAKDDKPKKITAAQIAAATNSDLMDVAVDKPVWPLAKCDSDGCTTIAKWSRMKNVWSDAINGYLRYCFRCTAVMQGCSEAEARKHIMDTAPGVGAKRDRLAAFLDAVENCQKMFPWCSKTGLRTISLESMTELTLLCAGVRSSRFDSRF